MAIHALERPFPLAIAHQAFDFAFGQGQKAPDFTSILLKLNFYSGFSRYLFTFLDSWLLSNPYFSTVKQLDTPFTSILYSAILHY
jgi:hypothetical protein